MALCSREERESPHSSSSKKKRKREPSPSCSAIQTEYSVSSSSPPPQPSLTNLHKTLQTPLLMLLPNQEIKKEEDSVVSFFSLEGKKMDVKDIAQEQELCNSRCVGSSHGWLILLDEQSDPYLFNPFSGSQIQLPFKETLPHLIQLSNSFQQCGFDIEYRYRNSIVSRFITTKDLQQSLVVKAVLSSDPSLNQNSFSVVLIYGYDAKICFFNKGGYNSWTEIVNGENWPYCDIICQNNRLFALSESGSIEVWNFPGSGFPTKTMNFRPSFPKKAMVNCMQCCSDRDRFSSQWYLVESRGDLLLVVRYIGEFVRDDGVAVSGADLLTDEDIQPLVFPYKTMEFGVYKLNFLEQKWVEVESLGDCALFLGGNHSLSVSIPSQFSWECCKRNSVYFTDDYWARVNEDYSYGGHDMGVFSLEDKSVEPLNNELGDVQKIEPPPLWVVPNLCNRCYTAAILRKIFVHLFL